METSRQTPISIALFLLLIAGAWAFYSNGTPVITILWSGFIAGVFWLVKAGRFETTVIRTAALGVLIDFILLFTIHKLHPEEDIAGIVLISLFGSGVLFAILGYMIQLIFGSKTKTA